MKNKDLKEMTVNELKELRLKDLADANKESAVDKATTDK